ncbi:unnamed protein product [Prorocentrum cordatum]|uniref:Uncharacterized protein n=1 Tax=Prorocentrum cordatum TaxID=2364126 RepID=A0ABN9U6G1_9DINO|nr:unnamed protein product [Polarella glacialis]
MVPEGRQPTRVDGVFAEPSNGSAPEADVQQGDRHVHGAWDAPRREELAGRVRGVQSSSLGREQGGDAPKKVGSPAAGMAVAFLEGLLESDVGGKAKAEINAHMDKVQPPMEGIAPTVSKLDMDLVIQAIRVEKTHDENVAKIIVAAPFLGTTRSRQLNLPEQKSRNQARGPRAAGMAGGRGINVVGRLAVTQPSEALSSSLTPIYFVRGETLPATLPSSRRLASSTDEYWRSLGL